MLRTLPKIINDNQYDIYNLRPRKPLILRTPDASCCFFSQIPGTDFLQNVPRLGDSKVATVATSKALRTAVSFIHGAVGAL
jgi:hypothetical protein